MNVPAEREIVERLGDRGLARVLGDVLDHGRLVQVANACGISYPGMRTRSQRKERIVADLVEKAKGDEAARKAIVRALRKETAPAARAYGEMSAGDRARWIDEHDSARGNGGLGARLFVLASLTEPGTFEEPLASLLKEGEGSTPAKPAPAAAGQAPSDRESARLKKRIAEFQKKIQYLEGQLAKGRDTEKALKRDLVERKGELAEARMLAERLRREFQDARRSASEPSSPGPTGTAAPEGAWGEIASGLRKLTAEQRKLVHRMEKLAELPATVSAETLAPVLDSLLEIQKETASLRRERKKDLQAQAERMEDLAAAVRGAARAAAEASPAKEKKPARRKGEPARVGVFVDVQNMYYGARQLKGKLDFDALLEAAVLDRRLIQTTAYVVESREIDQSGFIAMLEQRAIEVRRKRLRVRSDGSMKGDWDMEMALDILDAAPRLDVVVLVSGDGDFTSLVNRVKSIGPRVEVIAFPRNTAKSLLEAADRFQPLDRRYMVRVAGAAQATEEPQPTRATPEASEPAASATSKP